jgi:hypothetical protein
MYFLSLAMSTAPSLRVWMLSRHSSGQRGYKLIKKFSMMQLLIWLTISSLRELIICI